MPTKTPSPAKKGRHSAPSRYSTSPLHGTFRRVSGSRTSANPSQSLSPQKKTSPRKKGHAKHPLHIRMNLTETQMDRITDAFASKMNTSPTRSRHGVGTPQSSPRRNKSTAGYHRSARSLGSNIAGVSPCKGYDSPTFAELMPGYGSPDPAAYSSAAGKIAERRQKVPPTPIQVGTTGRRPREETHEHVVSPMSASHVPSEKTASAEYSAYSQDSGHFHPSQQPLPLDVRQKQQQQQEACYESHYEHPSIEANQAWHQGQGQDPFLTSNSSPSRYHSSPSRHHRSKSTDGGIQRQATPIPPLPGPAAILTVPQRSPARGEPSPLFSPLALYFRSDEGPTTKKGQKTMIGQNGWLERTGGPTEGDTVKKNPQKRARIIDSIKKIAKDMTENYNHRRTQSNAKESHVPRLAISLDAREQSLLYCELEFHLTNTVNGFITRELDRGHLDPDKLKKIADAWQQHGRPRVVGFRYDLETQLDLVALHVRGASANGSGSGSVGAGGSDNGPSFTFYGRRQGSPAEIAGLLHSMRVNARAMRVRTFCQPDTVIAKHLVDSQSLFNLVGATRPQQVALAEIAGFFKVIIERELDYQRQREAADAEAASGPGLGGMMSVPVLRREGRDIAEHRGCSAQSGGQEHGIALAREGSRGGRERSPQRSPRREAYGDVIRVPAYREEHPQRYV